ncbi:MAG: SDR family oxidoreductase [Myxococcota bacterium]
MAEQALIQGAARGIGLGLTRQLLDRGAHVVATCRNPETAHALHELHSDRLRVLRLDVREEASIADAAAKVRETTDRLHLLMNVSGLLHDGDLQPEKKLQHATLPNLQRVFEVNAFGPLLVAKHFAPFFAHRERSVLANLSARVGSIGDNRLGGWYAYRASKAAQNMFTKNLAIELGRRSKTLAVIALHPGTVDTNLSAPFSSRVPEEKLFRVERAATQLLDVIDKITPEDTGQFFAWDGSSIPW